MGRCPKCAWFEWKLQSVPLCMIEEYRKMATEHNRLQLAQKQAYSWRYRRAFEGFERDDDAPDEGRLGGIGLRWLAGILCLIPCLRGRVVRPEEAGHAECSFAVMNVLIHGDSRSHIILSPASVPGGAIHTLETILIAVNQFLLDHGDLAPELWLTLRLWNVCM